MAKDSFILYDSYGEQIKLLSMEERGQLLTAIFTHRAGEELPTMSTAVKMLFIGIRQQIDRDEEKYKYQCEKGREFGHLGAEFGKLGGRPKKNVESYEQIMDDMQLTAAVKNTTWEFIKHCNLNGHKLTNEKLSSLLVALDMQTDTDEQKITLLNNAINGGYYDIKRVN